MPRLEEDEYGASKVAEDEDRDEEDGKEEDKYSEDEQETAALDKVLVSGS